MYVCITKSYLHFLGYPMYKIRVCKCVSPSSSWSLLNLDLYDFGDDDGEKHKDTKFTKHPRANARHGCVASKKEWGGGLSAGTCAKTTPTIESRWNLESFVRFPRRAACLLPPLSLRWILPYFFFVSTRANGARWRKIDESFVGGCLAKGKFFLSRSSTPEECYRFLVRLQIGFGFALPRRRARGLRVRCFI